MASCNYNKSTRTFTAVWKDYAKARYFFEKLELTKELYKSEYYLDLIAKRAKQKQEMMKKASNERFIPLP